MTSQSLEVVKSDDNEISSNDEEDKKFVSQAVAFVIGHARNGFVPLCASVATLLKEQARLKQELQSVKEELQLLTRNSSKVNRFPERTGNKEIDTSVKNQRLCVSETATTDKTPENAAFKHSSHLPYRVLKGCSCSQCFQNKTAKPLIVPLKKGVKVVIRGEICGIVHYVGHIDSLDFPEIYVGLKLSAPVGSSDGSIGDKKYFSVPKNYGIFVPLTHVRCVIRNDIVKT